MFRTWTLIVHCYWLTSPGVVRVHCGDHLKTQFFTPAAGLKATVTATAYFDRHPTTTTRGSGGRPSRNGKTVSRYQLDLLFLAASASVLCVVACFVASWQEVVTCLTSIATAAKSFFIRT